MRDDRPTTQMEAFDLRLLAEATGRHQRPTAKMERLDLSLLWQEPAAVHPMLTVITTPADMRERWLTWVRVKGSLAITILLLATLLAAIRFV